MLKPAEVLKRVQEATAYIQSKTNLRPEIGIILGSGLGAFVREMKVTCTLPFAEIPHFLPTTVEGHQGNLIFGHIDNKPVVALQGRNHFYEGHSMDMVVLPTRVMAMLGVKLLVITNSAGGMGDGMQAGDFMVIDDHINLTGTNPLLGPNVKEFGPRFPDMSEAYNHELSDLLASILKKTSSRYHRGVYGGLSGPTYETPSEVRYLKMIGCHAVGMSTVCESIVANHMGLKVVGLSCISNLAAGIAKHRLSHSEVTETGKTVEVQFTRVLREFVASVPNLT